MKKNFWTTCLLWGWVMFFSLTGCAVVDSKEAGQKKHAGDFPAINREMRAAWIATVANIDWPSQPGLSVEIQKQEAIDILDKLVSMNMNAVVFQVRPHADALYPSELEPWSYYLTGEQGKAPDPFYDPMEFWIEECHARGIEFHAWFNPYRAGHPSMRGEFSEDSVVKSNPEWVRKLGDRGFYWMDPAMQEVQDRSYDVIMDVVNRYDVDGIHFDDYFYPYPAYNDGEDFPDDETYEAYLAQGGTMERDDWRRDAVNRFVKRLYDGIKAERPHVIFSISPFGIYRSGVPETVGQTFDQYEALYADALLWYQEGWVDFYTPQLYWPISRIRLSFPVLLRWWLDQNKAERHLWPGLVLYHHDTPEKAAHETVNQVMISRGVIGDNPGTVHFSMRHYLSNEDLYQALKEGPYASPAIVPAYPWLSDITPPAPEIYSEISGSELTLSWDPVEDAFQYILYCKQGGEWNYEILPRTRTEAIRNLAGTDLSAVALSYIDRFGNESEKTEYKIKRIKE